MATDIPQELLDLARQHAAARAATEQAARDGGAVAEATAVEARAAAALLAYRAAHPEWATMAAQKQVREALAGGA